MHMLNNQKQVYIYTTTSAYTLIVSYITERAQTYIYIYTSVCVYKYREREKERNRNMCVGGHT